MNSFRIIGLGKMPVMAYGNTPQAAVNSRITISCSHANFVIVAQDGNTIYVQEEGDCAYGACCKYVAQLPRDPRTQCETRHALRALKRVGHSASVESWQKALSFVRNLCPNCNPDLRKKHNQGRIVTRNTRVHLTKSKDVYIPGNLNVAVSAFSIRSSKPRL